MWVWKFASFCSDCRPATAAAAAAYLVACTAEALLDDHVVHWLIIHAEYERRAILLVVGLLAVCQTG